MLDNRNGMNLLNGWRKIMDKLFIFICTILLVCGCHEYETKTDENGNIVSTGVCIIQDNSVRKYRYKDHYYLLLFTERGSYPLLVHDPDCPCKKQSNLKYIYRNKHINDMSYTEYHVGKIKPIQLKGNDLERYCKQVLSKYNYIDKDSLDEDNLQFYNSYVELLIDELDDEYIYLNGILYKIVEDEEGNEDNVHITINDDGTINYKACFYNGTTCLTSELERTLKEKLK